MTQRSGVESRKRIPRIAPINREAPVDTAVIAPQDDREIVQAANDDQESIGQILQSMQRTPKGVSFFVASAFGSKKYGVEKNAPTSQPVVHSPQKWHAGCPSCGCVSCAQRSGKYGTPTLLQAASRMKSRQRNVNGGKYEPSGLLGRFCTVLATPIIFSTRV